MKNFTSCKTVKSIIVLMLLAGNSFSQYKSFSLSPKGDTINRIDKKDLKQGKWVITVPELRGEPGYIETGFFKDGKKEGTWRQYDNTEDLMALEQYKYGGKDGVQQYFTRIGALVREESWRAYNPDAPYDTIPIYGTGNNEILSYKIVKAEQYSVPHGEWKYYEASTGRLLRAERFDRGAPIKEGTQPVVVDETPKKMKKPIEVLEFEKLNSRKKKVKLREGATGVY